MKRKYHWIGFVLKIGTCLGFLFLVGCTSSGVVPVNDHSMGCSGLMPVTTLNNKGINIELANLIVQEVATGKFKVEYTSTMEALLSEKVLDHWVRQELICQGSKTFETPEQRIWFITMKETSEKNTPQEFLQWLRENPFDSFKEGETLENKLDPDLTAEIKYINGTVMLPSSASTATIETIHSGGILIIPGPTKVVVGYCNGKIKHHIKAKIIISTSHSSCLQEILQ